MAGGLVFGVSERKTAAEMFGYYSGREGLMWGGGGDGWVEGFWGIGEGLFSKGIGALDWGIDKL